MPAAFDHGVSGRLYEHGDLLELPMASKYGVAEQQRHRWAVRAAGGGAAPTAPWSHPAPGAGVADTMIEAYMHSSTTAQIVNIQDGNYTFLIL